MFIVRSAQSGGQVDGQGHPAPAQGLGVSCVGTPCSSQTARWDPAPAGERQEQDWLPEPGLLVPRNLRRSGGSGHWQVPAQLVGAQQRVESGSTRLPPLLLARSLSARGMGCQSPAWPRRARAWGCWHKGWWACPPETTRHGSLPSLSGSQPIFHPEEFLRHKVRKKLKDKKALLKVCKRRGHDCLLSPHFAPLCWRRRPPHSSFPHVPPPPTSGHPSLASSVQTTVSILSPRPHVPSPGGSVPQSWAAGPALFPVS